MWGRLSYDGGSNGIMLTFFRAAIALPVLLVILKCQGVSMKLTKQEVKDLLCIGIPGPAMATLLLYSSYEYIGTGIATVLHFTYPAVVVLAGVVLFREKIGKGKLVALMCSVCGMLFFFEPGTKGGTTGILLALGSSIAYTIYMVGVEKTSLKHMHHFKLTFYVCCISMVESFTVGCFADCITFSLTPMAWFYTVLVALFVSLGAVTLLQLGIQLIGASSTAILSTLEPITSVALGALILKESLSVAKGIGCVCILCGVVGVTLMQTRRSDA